MGRDGRRQAGGILGLVDLLEGDEDALTALEADLIREGVRLRWVGDGTDRLSWRDVLVLVKHMDGTAALAAQLSGDDSKWDLQTHLLASVVDGVRAMVWQNGGGKGPRPKPIPRSFGKDNVTANSGKAVPQGDPFKENESGVFKGEMTPLSELNKWLGWDEEQS